MRASLTRISSNAARHLLDDSETSNLALANDLVEAAKLIPNASIEWLIEGLDMLPEERRAGLVDVAHGLQACQGDLT